MKNLLIWNKNPLYLDENFQVFIKNLNFKNGLDV